MRYCQTMPSAAVSYYLQLRCLEVSMNTDWLIDTHRTMKLVDVASP
jgi:hypothetical protein